MTFDSISPSTLEDGSSAPLSAMPGQPRDWRTTEIAVLRARYPTGGAKAVHADLPHRTLAAIRGKAATLRLRCQLHGTTGKRFARRYPQRDDIDMQIREGYIAATRKGDIMALAARIGRPAWWVQKRAATLGCTRTNRTRVDVWRREELDVLETWSTCTIKVIRDKLRAAGFQRTETAIGVKLKRLKIDRHDPDAWPAPELASMLGVNPATVADWIARRGLPATRETWGPNGRFIVRRKQFRAWLTSHSRYVDLRRVDQTWFMDLAFGPRA